MALCSCANLAISLIFRTAIPADVTACTR